MKPPPRFGGGGGGALRDGGLVDFLAAFFFSLDGRLGSAGVVTTSDGPNSDVLPMPSTYATRMWYSCSAVR